MKLAGEYRVKDYARRGCFDYPILGLSAVYGPVDVEPSIVSKFMFSAMPGRVLKVNESLDVTSVDFCIYAIFTIIFARPSASIAITLPTAFWYCSNVGLLIA